MVKRHLRRRNNLFNSNSPPKNPNIVHALSLFLSKTMHPTPSSAHPHSLAAVPPPPRRLFEGAVTTASMPEYQSNPPFPPVPPNHAANPRSPLPWSTGLCECFSDCSSCCLTFWCPCVSFGRIAEIVDRGSISCALSGALYTLLLCLTGCGCLYSCFYRSKLRGQFFLEESPCADCCVHCLCEQCALCQEYRELKNRGFDLSIGWHGNMERQKRLAAAAAAIPAIETGMTR